MHSSDKYRIVLCETMFLKWPTVTAERTEGICNAPSRNVCRDEQHLVLMSTSG